MKPLASKATAFIGHVKTAVNVDHSAASGTYDLSLADSVKIGHFKRNPLNAKPFVMISVGSVTTEFENVPMGTYQRTLSLDVIGFAPGRTPALRTSAALDIANDIATSIENDAYGSSGNLAIAGCLWCVIEQSAVDGDEFNIAPNYGIGFCTVELKYRTTRGT